jgi:hypothetical protein
MLIKNAVGSSKYKQDENGVWWYYFGKNKPTRTKALIKKCLNCGEEYLSMPLKSSKAGKYNAKFCSHSCSSKYLYGNKLINIGKGEKCKSWKGGRNKIRGGYIEIFCPQHPAARGGKYVREHRLVMEKYLGRYLYPWEEIHHRNGIHDDNRIENLELISGRMHFGEIECPHCHKKFVIR